MESKILERSTLYARGLNDAEIARQQGVNPTAVLYWRRRRGLPANAGNVRREGDPTPMRRLLYNLGWGAQRIAKYQGVSVDAVKDWRKRHGLTPKGLPYRGDLRSQEGQFAELQKRVVRAVGSRLPYDIAADAAAALMLDVIEGRVPLDQIERQGRVYGNRALQEFANPFTTRSLDAEVPGSGGLREIDRLADDGASAWLERMGATVH